MLRSEPIFAQGKFIENYNQIITMLIQSGIYEPNSLMDVGGICAGLCEVRILKKYEMREDEFYNAFKKIAALEEDDFKEIHNLLILSMKDPNLLTTKTTNKLAIVADIFKTSENPRVKQLTYQLLNFIDGIQKTHTDNKTGNFKSIGGNWDDTFTFSCHKLHLSELLNDYLIKISNKAEGESQSAHKKSQSFYCSLIGKDLYGREGGHGFVIEKNEDNTFKIYDPNAGEREDSIILKDIAALKNRIITIANDIGFNNEIINLSLQPVSFGKTDKNKVLSTIFRNDHPLFQISSALNDLRNNYLRNDVSDGELIRMLQDWFRIDQNIKLTDEQLQTLIFWQQKVDKFPLFKMSTSLIVTDKLLDIAINRNEVSLIKSILENGFDINYKNAKGLTMLQTAILSNCPLMAKFLIDAGCDLNKLLITKEDPDGMSYLEYAIYRGCLSRNEKAVESVKTMINLLVDKGLILQPMFALKLEVLRETNQNNPFAMEILNFVDTKFFQVATEIIDLGALNPNLALKFHAAINRPVQSEQHELTPQEKLDKLMALKVMIDTTTFHVKNWLGSIVEGTPSSIKTISSDLSALKSDYREEDASLIENIFEKTRSLLLEGQKPSDNRLESTRQFYEDEYKELISPPNRQYDITPH